jgi:hypothetical protein
MPLTGSSSAAAQINPKRYDLQQDTISFLLRQRILQEWGLANIQKINNGFSLHQSNMWQKFGAARRQLRICHPRHFCPGIAAQPPQASASDCLAYGKEKPRLFRG